MGSWQWRRFRDAVADEIDLVCFQLVGKLCFYSALEHKGQMFWCRVYRAYWEVPPTPWERDLGILCPRVTSRRLPKIISLLRNGCWLLTLVIGRRATPQFSHARLRILVHTTIRSKGSVLIYNPWSIAHVFNVNHPSVSMHAYPSNMCFYVLWSWNEFMISLKDTPIFHAGQMLYQEPNLLNLTLGIIIMIRFTHLKIFTTDGHIVIRTQIQKL